MTSVPIIQYYSEYFFENPPDYTLVTNAPNSIRIEWEEFDSNDTDEERWAVITYSPEASTLYIDFEYNSFQFNIDLQNIEEFFNLYSTNVEKFVEPLNKKLSMSMTDTIDYWENIVFEYTLDNTITEKEYIDAINFFRTKCNIKAPSIVIENILLESPLLNSLFRDPLKIFPILYKYPFCTDFFLKYIMPLLYDVLVNKKIFK